MERQRANALVKIRFQTLVRQQTTHGPQLDSDWIQVADP